MTRIITEKVSLNFSDFETISEAKEFIDDLLNKYGDMPITNDTYYEDYDVFCAYTREANAQDILKEDYENNRSAIWEKKHELENKRYSIDDSLVARSPKPSYPDSFQVVHSFINNKEGVTGQDIEDAKAAYPDKRLQFKYVDKVAVMVETGNAPYEVDMQKYEKELADWLGNESQRVKELYAELKEVEAELASVKKEEANLHEAYRKAVNGTS